MCHIKEKRMKEELRSKIQLAFLDLAQEKYAKVIADMEIEREKVQGMSLLAVSAITLLASILQIKEL
jgi:ABC-type phosphate/phosphonate transport system substrate-binding protein